MRKNDIDEAMECMMDKDIDATFWSALRHITKYCEKNHITWGMFDSIVETIDHYMSHVHEVLEDAAERGEIEVDGSLDPDDLVISAIGIV